MKRTSSACLLALVTAVTPAQAQGTFQNLDFEAAKLIFIGQSGRIATTDALPGWRTFVGAIELTTVAYDDFTSDYSIVLAASNSAISGDFSVYLGNSGAISQVGIIPADAKALLLKADIPPYVAELRVYWAGQRLPLVAISGGPNYTLYGADVSLFAAQTAALAISGPGLLDDLQFSPEAIPETSALTLFGLGGFLFAAHRFRRRRGKF